MGHGDSRLIELVCLDGRSSERENLIEKVSRPTPRIFDDDVGGMERIDTFGKKLVISSAVERDDEGVLCSGQDKYVIWGQSAVTRMIAEPCDGRDGASVEQHDEVLTPITIG